MITLTQKDLEKLSHSKRIAFAVFAIEQIKYLIKDSNSLYVFTMIKRYINGNASSKMCLSAADLAYTANAISETSKAISHAAYTTKCAQSSITHLSRVIYYTLLSFPKNEQDLVLKDLKTYYDILNSDLENAVSF